MQNSLASVLYISHGGGPLPILGDPGHLELVAFLRKVPEQLIRPSAIVVISAHWEEPIPTVTGNAKPALIYDYAGFPPESYMIEYPVPGEPGLAQEIVRHLQSNGINASMDNERGIDHGVFIPLKLMYPEASIPCVQLSLVKGLQPDIHIAVGKALTVLRQRNILIIGSGFSFHNLRAFFSPPTSEGRKQNELFEQWLVETCSSKAFSAEERERRLLNWTEAPGARYCHPREEHLMPLHVCYGVAKDVAQHNYSLEIMHKQASMYLW